MINIEDKLDRLTHVERLDDIKTLLTPRELDEVPFVSRLQRIDFLAPLDAHEKTRLLLIASLRHLRRVLMFAETNNRTDVVAMLSIANWEDLRSANPDPLIPNFWICTNVARDLARFRLKPGASGDARQTSDWLRSADLLESHEVLEAVEVARDPDLRRVYVAERPSPAVEPFVMR